MPAVQWERGHDTGGTVLSTTIIDWDGTNFPEDMRELPPGRFIVQYVEEIDELTEEEEAGILHALAQVEAGDVFGIEDVMRDIRSRTRRGTL